MSGWSAEWNGDDLVERTKRAQARAILAIAEVAAAEAKRLAHVYTGTMRRSIHVAPADYIPYRDEMAAQSDDLQASTTVEPTETETGAMVLLGSWVHYADIEEVVRGHEFITPAVESVRTQAAEIIRRAAEEEGLS
jgi:hypothetical protein